MSTVDALVAGDHAALARALTLLERGGPEAAALRAALRPHTGRGTVVGVTGPPGAGKSSLIADLVTVLRARDMRVAVIAVDPSSPISGGAVLGDRARMGTHTADEGVFIRSVASRGQSGGLARAVPAFLDAVDAAGWPIILLETVGSGQSDVDVAELADVAVLVSVPGLGDDLQAIKSGMLELADVLVVNKCDLPGAERTARQLESMLTLRRQDAARPPVIRTSTLDSTGVVALLDAVNGTARAGDSLRRVRSELLIAAEAEFARRLRHVPIDKACAAVRAGTQGVEEIVADLLASISVHSPESRRDLSPKP
ncbi:LAO/AO transport system ATPase [Mycobacterium lentiflavum]|uniref:LAO/AO transport system ATPase n=1 Tax=Mycobacterium lentiflavum TaxID=141349 RepID=A0A0E4CRG1_MYCLN|nr:methylmalonyl Co-A mutase-associated GTPase MeaB [Mycobacterium lentiflavum]CQD24319.1 LAO/AO transport system ATPase [Mycobacterium lentiflavum]